mgnify:FL=1
MEDEIYEIIAKVIAGETMSDEERQDLEVWRLEHEREYQLLVRLKEPVKFIQERGGIVQEVAYKRVARRLERGKQRKIRRYAYISAVAGVVLVIGIALTWWVQPFEEEGMMEQSFRSGNGQVMLTLKHGVVVPLKRDVKEVIVADTVLRVTNEGNTLVYSVMQGVALEDTYNVLTVPVGGEFRVILSDGTMVFLNSGSELRYPEVFRDGQREVFLKGEAWFEVAKDSVRLFRVHAGEMDVRVLGTSFNVKAYERMESIAMTLVTGSVEVTCNYKSFRIVPGEQFEYRRGLELASVREVDTELYTSWKDGYYKFRQASLEEIMTTLSVWYGLEVFYQNEEAKRLEFTGKVKRYEDVGNLLRKFEQTENVVFNRKGNNVIIQLK